MDHFPELLRRQSLRVTRQRTAVMRFLHEHPHADVAAIVDGVEGEIGRISKQAVYDVVTALSDAGLVRKIDLAGSAALFELMGGNEHDHAVCRGCGAIFDTAAVATPGPVEPAPGFVVDQVHVIYRGTCPPCREAHPSITRPTSPREERGEN